MIDKATSDVQLGVGDAAAEFAATAGVAQAQQNVTVLRMALQTDVSLAIWENLRIQKNGTSSDPGNPFGRNTDIKFVRLFKDIELQPPWCRWASTFPAFPSPSPGSRLHPGLHR